MINLQYITVWRVQLKLIYLRANKICKVKVKNTGSRRVLNLVNMVGGLELFGVALLFYSVLRKKYVAVYYDAAG